MASSSRKSVFCLSRSGISKRFKKSELTMRSETMSATQIEKICVGKSEISLKKPELLSQ